MSPADFVSPLRSQETDVLIIGAGPVGLFAAFQLGLLGLKARLIDTLDRPGGQCAELYPDKPIYDIPGWPVISGQELTDRLIEQIAPFEPEFRFNQRVDSLTRRPDGSFQIVTDAGEVHVAPVVFIAAGVGSFTPRRLKLGGIEPYEGKSLFYAVRERAEFEGSDLVILGGGDSALDWALDLLPAVKSLTLVHRRDKFRAVPHTVRAMEAAVAEGRMNFVMGVLERLDGDNGELTAVTVKSETGSTTIEADRVLAFFGLNIELGPIAEWSLDLEDGKQIRVDTAKFQTSTPGIFAIGDINSYPGKLKLILCGFHESALAAQEAFRIARPDEKLRFQYTTSSSELKRRLKVA
ncbi:MAG: NAD(P)/FAD-dependent oxidoreductase [Proteobacteria bacterium]|nr:NAD(P)/FAD-dependent oxidoreductase [Pseudomonadota bacterium]